MKLKDIVKQAIDIHVHIGPEIIPRKYTIEQLIKEEQGKIGGFVLKNHFYPTTPFIRKVKPSDKLRLFGSIVLNSAVGGLNPEAIYAANLIANSPIMVWFPTIHAENFLKQSKYEIAPEWVKKKGFQARLARDVKSVVVTKNKKLTQEAIYVLRVIKKCNGVLATGHISWEESMILINKAIKMGIPKIVVTHPIYQKISMPINIQKDLAQKGCFIEQSYSMYFIDKISIPKIVNQIKKVGSNSVILSSDVGQTFGPSPSEALLKFSTLLNKRGMQNNELFTMMVTNPKKLLKII